MKGIHFENPGQAIWLLLLIPTVLAWVIRQRKKKRVLQALATSPPLLRTLIAGYHPAKENREMVALAGAIVCMAIAAMNPRVVNEKALVAMEGIEVMLLIDVSNSMLAKDNAPNRLEKARNLALNITGKLAGNKVGLLAFAGEARLQMPPTIDLSAIRQGIEILMPDVIPVQGTNIEAALAETRSALAARPQSYKAALLITDGEELEGEALSAANALSQAGITLAVVGIGTTEGVVLQQPENGKAWLDDQNNPVLTRLNEPLLQQLAAAGNGKYYTMETSEKTATAIVQAFASLPAQALPAPSLVNYYSFAPWFMGLAGIFLWLPLYGFWQKKARKTPGLGMPVVFAILMGLLPVAVKAQASFNQAYTDYRNGNWEEALTAWSTLLTQEPQNAEIRFLQALTYYKLNKFTEAAEAFSALAPQLTATPALQAAALHNAGLSLARNGKTTEAIQALKQAMRLSPSDAAIIRNLQKALSEQEKQHPPPDKENKPPPPLKEQDARQKLETLMEEEKKTRQKMKPRAEGGQGRNW